MIRKFTLLLSVAIFSSTILVGQSFTALYSFDSVKAPSTNPPVIGSGQIDPTPVPTVAGITFGSFSATGTSVNPNAASRFSYTSWPTGATSGNDLYASLTGSINTSEYYEVTFTPDPGYTIDLSSITFSAQRSGTGIRTYAVRSSADAYVTNLSASIDPVNTNLSVQTGDVFFWNFDATVTNQNGSTITLNGPDFTAISSAISFRFYGWNSEGTIGTFSIDNVTITGTVTAPLTANFTANDVCWNNATDFTDLSTSANGTIVTWMWDFGDGSPMGNTQNPTHTFSQPGKYIITLDITDDLLNTDSYIDSVYVYDKPNAEAGIFPGPTSICAGIVAQFSDGTIIGNGTIVSHYWNFGDPASGTNDSSTLLNPAHTYTTPASYPITEIVTSDMGCKDTLNLNIAVSPNPVAAFSFTIAGGVIFTDLTSGATSWFWDFGDPTTTSDTSHIQNPSYSNYPVDLPATACLTVTNTFGCADSVCEVVFTAGINNTSLEAMTMVYPNPSANGIFTVNTGNNSGKTIVTVSNIIGKIIFSKELDLTGKETIDLSNEANGSYFVNIKNDKQNSTKKITINK